MLRSIMYWLILDNQVRVYDSVLVEELNYKAILISEETTVEDVIRSIITYFSFLGYWRVCWVIPKVFFCCFKFTHSYLWFYWVILWNAYISIPFSIKNLPITDTPILVLVGLEYPVGLGWLHAPHPSWSPQTRKWETLTRLLLTLPCCPSCTITS